MKAIRVLLIIFFILLVVSNSASATVGPSVEESETAEVIAITGSTMFALGNVMTIAGKVPLYWMGGLSIAAGAVTMALATQDRPPYELGLWVSGTAAIATGFMALRYRHVLNDREKHARLEPAWTNGSPGLALVVDF